MLRYEVNHAAGVPQTVVSGFAPRGEADHWTATVTGRAAAESVVRNFIATRATVNASYHVLDWHDHAAEITYAMEIVPLDRASHSMNPAKAFVPKTGSAREQARFAEVHRILARDSDPNADCVSVAFVGMPADLAAAVACPVYRADRRELSRRLRATAPTIVERPHFGHGWIQPTTRYEADAAPGGADLLIDPVLYAQEDAMPTPSLYYVPQLWRAKAGGADLREQADLGAPVVGTVPADGLIFSVGEDQEAGVRWRLVVAGEPERLLYAARAQIDPLPPTPRDPDLYGGIAAVVNARAAGQPPPSADCGGAVAEAEQETTARVNQTWRAWLATAPKS